MTNPDIKIACEALEPFAKIADDWFEMGRTRHIGIGALTVGDLRHARTAYDRLSSLSGESETAPGVKALEWKEPGIATALGLTYDVWLTRDAAQEYREVWLAALLCHERERIGNFTSKEKAQEACQADFERRIRSALTTPVRAEIEPASAEAGAGPVGEISVELMQRIWANLFYDEDDAGFTFQGTLNDVVDWLAARGALPEPEAKGEAGAGPVGETKGGVWGLDVSTGTEILTYQNCSVIEDAQARYVLRLIADQRGPVAKDVAVLVVAARAAAYEDWTEEVRASLDEAVEAFSERVAWECDDEIGDEENGEVDPAVLDAIASVWDTQAGAGPVGEAVGDAQDEQAAVRFYHDNPRAALFDLNRRLAVRPVDEPGEVERLRAEAHNAHLAVKEERALAAAAEAALAETRERLEKVEAALDAAHYYIDAHDIELSEAGITRADALDRARDLRATLSTQESSAALAGDGKEVAR